MDGLGRPSNNPLFDSASAVAFLGESSDDFRLKAHDLGHGHLEVSAHRPIRWVELEWSHQQIADHLEMVAEYREEFAVEHREKVREKAAKRARTRVRRLCKVMGAVSMLTLTYRENQQDLDLCKKHLKEFVRRVRRVWPGFMAVAGFEPQERGSWHVHLACPRVPVELMRDGVKVKSFNLLRAIWRGVVGVDNGNIDVSNRKRNSKRSPAKLAAYLSKYILKAFIEGADYSNRWTKFGNFDVPPPVDLGRGFDALRSILAAYGLGECGHTVSSFLSRFSDCMFFAFEGVVHEVPS